jgi:hypothetical protein
MKIERPQFIRQALAPWRIPKCRGRTPEKVEHEIRLKDGQSESSRRHVGPRRDDIVERSSRACADTYLEIPLLAKDIEVKNEETVFELVPHTCGGNSWMNSSDEPWMLVPQIPLA